MKKLFAALALCASPALAQDIVSYDTDQSFFPNFTQNTAYLLLTSCQ